MSGSCHEPSLRRHRLDAKSIGQFPPAPVSQGAMRQRTRRKVMRTRSAWTLAVAAIASLMVALDALVVTTALPTIRLHLGASIEELEWTVNAYTLSFAVL